MDKEDIARKKEHLEKYLKGASSIEVLVDPSGNREHGKRTKIFIGDFIRLHYRMSSDDQPDSVMYFDGFVSRIYLTAELKLTESIRLAPVLRYNSGVAPFENFTIANLKDPQLKYIELLAQGDIAAQELLEMRKKFGIKSAA